MTKLIALAASVAASVAVVVSATDIVYTSCTDGACTQGCERTLVKRSSCAAAPNGTSLTATFSDEDVGLWHMDTFNNPQCTGAPVRFSGICNMCSGGMHCMCGGLPGALMIRYNCPQYGNDQCGECQSTIRLPFGECTEIPSYTPQFSGYVYALADWGCIDAGKTAKVSLHENSATCGGKANKYSAGLGVCNQGKLFEVANSTSRVNLK